MTAYSRYTALWRGVEGPQRCLPYPYRSTFSATEVWSGGLAVETPRETKAEMRMADIRWRDGHARTAQPVV